MKSPILYLPVATLLFALSAAAIEPWADEKLPVKDGLELWLSAAQENRARTTMIPPSGPLDIGHEASGRKHHVRQPAESLRPKFFPLPYPAVRFDGAGDFLAATA